MGLRPSISAHPADALLHRGVPVTISTDARTTANTTLDQEFSLLRRTFGWGPDEHALVQDNARRGSFSPGSPQP